MKSEEVTQDEVRRFGLNVAQPVNGYRFSLDALLLADFVRWENPGDSNEDVRIADLGTGCGIIPLILCRRFSGVSVVGVESNAKMADLARANTLGNGLQNRIETISSDIVQLKSLFPVSSFDGIAANPPFRAMGSGRISPKAGRDTARHESTAGISDFLSIAKYLVKPSGRIWFVYHPDRLTEFIHATALLKLSLLRLRLIHDTVTAPAKIFLAELAKGRKGDTAILPPLIIHGEDGAYTPEANLILGN